MILKRITFLIVLIFFTPAKSEEAITLTDSNMDEFVVNIWNDYYANILLLNNASKRFTGNHTQFILWKNKEWTPRFDRQRSKYNAILEKNRKYLFPLDEMGLFSAFSNLPMAANDLMRGIRFNDSNHFDLAGQKLEEGIQRFQSVIESRNLQGKLKSKEQVLRENNF